MATRSISIGRRKAGALAGLCAAAAVVGGAFASSGASAARSPRLSAARSAAATAVSQAEAAIQPYLKAPTSVGVTTPLKTRPPKNVNIIAMSCQLSVCQTFRNEVAQAGAVLGWHTTGISFTGTPESTLQSVESAIEKKPTAIIINGESRSVYQTALAQAKANHVAIVTQMGELTGKPAGPIVDVQYQTPQFGAMSKITGDYVIASSGGHANAIVVKYADFPLSVYIADTMAHTITANCSTCKAQELLVQATDTGEQLASAVVSKIQADPSINYIVFQDGAMALGIDSALKLAGLEGKVKVVSNDVTPQVIQSIEAGDETAVMAFSLESAAYAGIDAVARHLEGMKEPVVPLANEIFTKSNLGSNPKPSLWNALPPNIAKQYAALWHVG